MEKNRILILGIETSCDETAAAVVARTDRDTSSRNHRDVPQGRILSNVVRSQLDEHRPYGGVVPEIAARAHVEVLDRIVAAALAEAGGGWSDLDGIAATAGPGLLGGVLIGLTTAKAIALVHDLPLIAVNHLEGHALSPGLTDRLAPPYLLLLISGGHTQLLIVRGVGQFERLGTTVDDALGEAFDKTAKLLGLGFPGGPAVEAAAGEGNPHRFDFPRPMLARPEPNFSFAGLKTAVRQTAGRLAPLSRADIADLCASFQQAVTDTLADRVCRAAEIYRERAGPDAQRVLVVAGGVAANRAIRKSLEDVVRVTGFSLVVPPPALCTDNAAMIAWAGAERLALGISDPLDAVGRARWPLDETAPRVGGAGTKA